MTKCCSAARSMRHTAKKDADAHRMLAALLWRDPGNIDVRLLCAELHRLAGAYALAEIELRTLFDRAPGTVVARLQLLRMRHAFADAKKAALPLAESDGAIGAYARAIRAFADGDREEAQRELGIRFELPMQLPSFADDLRALQSIFVR